MIQSHGINDNTILPTCIQNKLNKTNSNHYFRLLFYHQHKVFTLKMFMLIFYSRFDFIIIIFSVCHVAPLKSNLQLFSHFHPHEKIKKFLKKRLYSNKPTLNCLWCRTQKVLC